MVSYVLDTVTISEMRKSPPNASVVRLIETTPSENLYLSVLTIGEIADGIARMPLGTRRTQLLQWFRELQESYLGRVLPIDEETAEVWGNLTAAAHRSGGKLAVVDGLIAATALAHRLTVVTRNVKDFEQTGVAIVNPWLDEDDA